MRPIVPALLDKKAPPSSAARRSANRVFENHGDHSGDACSQGNLADQHDVADELAPEHSVAAKEKPRTRQGLSRFTHADGRSRPPGDVWGPGSLEIGPA